MSEKPVTTEAPAATEKVANKQVSTTVTPEKFAKLEDYRWENRINKQSEVIALAVDHFIATVVDAPKK